MALARDLGRRKLDGVTYEVGDHLAEAEGVTDELVGDVGLHIVREVKVVLRGTDDECLEDAKHRLPE